MGTYEDKLEGPRRPRIGVPAPSVRPLLERTIRQTSTKTKRQIYKKPKDKKKRIKHA